MSKLLPALDQELSGPATPLREGSTGLRVGQSTTETHEQSIIGLSDLAQNKDYPPEAGPKPKGTKPDSAAIIIGSNFQRPWLAIPGRKRFVWPLGVEAFTISLKPNLSIHKYIGDNRVEIDVQHVGEQRITLNGIFIGKTAAASMRALRDICEQPTPERGKVLHLPGVLPKYQYVFVEDFEADRTNEVGNTKIGYKITFVKATTAPVKTPAPSSNYDPRLGDRGSSGRVFITTALVNTARKIAKVVYGSEERWANLAKINSDLAKQAGVPLALLADYRIAPGTQVRY